MIMKPKGILCYDTFNFNYIFVKMTEIFFIMIITKQKCIHMTTNNDGKEILDTDNNKT